MGPDHSRKKIMRHCNSDDIDELKNYLMKEIKKQISEIERMFISKGKKNETISELSEHLTVIQKINNLKDLKEFVNNNILTLFTVWNTKVKSLGEQKTVWNTNAVTLDRQKEIQFEVEQLQIDYQIGPQKDQGSNQKNTTKYQGINQKDTPKENEYNEYENKRKIIESIKKRTIITEDQCNVIWERWKQIQIDLGENKFDFFIPQKKIRINDYLNNEEYASRRAQSTSPKKLCKLLNAIKKHMKEWWVDIDKDYLNQDIDYNDQILHSDSEAWKIAAEIMQLNWSHFVNIEKDSPKIPFEEWVQRSEAYTLMSHPGHFVLSKFKVNGPYNEAERYVLMEWV